VHENSCWVTIPQFFPAVKGKTLIFSEIFLAFSLNTTSWATKKRAYEIVLPMIVSPLDGERLFRYRLP
jgi:hypothetical protein